jgi:hypothetical protein
LTRAKRWDVFRYPGALSESVAQPISHTATSLATAAIDYSYATIAACNGNNGLVNSLISDPRSCEFDVRCMVGSPANCTSPGGPSLISEAAALVMNALWSSNETSLWYPHGYKTDSTGFCATLKNTCSDNGTWIPSRHSLLTDWIKYFIEKNPDYQLDNMIYRDCVSAF